MAPGSCSRPAHDCAPGGRWAALPSRGSNEDRAARARGLPETGPRTPSRRAVARSSAPLFTWAALWASEVLTSGVNSRRIDVRMRSGSRLCLQQQWITPLRSVGRPLVVQIRPTQGSWRSRHRFTAAESCPRGLLAYTTTNPINPLPYSFSNAAAYRTCRHRLTCLSQRMAQDRQASLGHPEQLTVIRKGHHASNS